MIFLPAAFLASLKRMPLRVILLLSIAFAFKAQAIFFAPLAAAVRLEALWTWPTEASRPGAPLHASVNDGP